MSKDFKTIKDRISPNVLRELTPVATNLILACLHESSKVNPDQLDVALYTGLAAFLSILRNGGHHDQAYRAAIRTSQSVPHAVVAANLIGDKYKEPKEKTLATINAASGLIKRAGLTTIPDFPTEKKEKIGRDIEGIANLYSLLPKNPKLKGKGLFGAGFGNFRNTLNTEWLNSDEDSLRGGAWWNPVSWFRSNPSPEVDNGFSYDWQDPNVMSSIYDDPQGMSDIYDDPYGQSPAWQDPNTVSYDWQDPNSFMNPNVQCTDADKSLWQSFKENIGSLGGAAVGLIKGSPLLQSFLIQAGIPILKGVGKVLGSALYFAGDKTYGRFRRWVKKQGWSDTNRTSFFGKIGNSIGRNLKSLYQTNDAIADSISEWYNKDKNRQAFRQLGKTIEYLAPALGQDYIGYKQKMEAYNQQNKRAKAEHDYEQAKEKEAIDRENAAIRAEAKRNRAEALLFNSDLNAIYDNDVEFHNRMVDYDRDVAQAKKDFVDAQKEIQKANLEFQRDEAVADLDHEKWKEIINSCANVGKSVRHAAEGVIDVALEATPVIKKFASSTTENVVDFGKDVFLGRNNGIDHLKSVEDFTQTAREYLEKAEEAKNSGNYSDMNKWNRKILEEMGKANKALNEGIQKSNETSSTLRNVFSKIKETGDKVWSDIGKAVDSGKDAAYYWGKRNRLLNKQIFTDPTDASLFMSTPRKAPVLTGEKYIPDEMTEDDPRLKKFIAKPFHDLPKPIDLYATPHTTNVVQNVLPYVLADKPKKEKIELPELPYVNPLPVTHVDPFQGAATAKLRTTVVPTRISQTMIRPKPVMAANSLTTLQPRRKISRHF